MKRIFGSLGVGGGALLLLIANLLSYSAGLVRDLIFADVFGATTNTDEYFAAFLVPDFLFNMLILAFVASALLPIFVEQYQRDPKKAEEVFQSFFGCISVFMVFACIAAYFSMPFLVELFSGGSENQETIIYFSRILLLSPFLFGISNTVGTILLAKKRFFAMAISPVLYNTGIILGIVFFGERYGIEAAIWGAVFGGLLHLSSRLIDIRHVDISLLPKLKFTKEVREIFLLGLPKMLGLAAFQIVLITFKSLSDDVGEGGFTAWNFARNIQSLPISLFGIAFATAALPFLSDFVASKKSEAFLSRFEKSSLQILFFTIPSAVGLFLLSNEIIAVLFEHGAFDAYAREITSVILCGISLAIPFESLTHLFSRAFLSHKNTVVPALGKTLFLVVAVSVAVYSVADYRVASFGISFFSAAFAELFFLTLLFHRKLHPLPFVHIFWRIFKILLLSGCMGLVIWKTGDFLEEAHEGIRLVAPLMCGGIFYLLGAFLLRMSELREIFLWKRPKNCNVE